eukprot:m.15377 g.15377  ORF g.15377 m.15377 type:complete len:121 (-) comp10733_c0_seq1:636-998(-)
MCTTGAQARGLQVNAHLSGDNCHRGSVLGFLLGLLHGAAVAAQESSTAGSESKPFLPSSLTTGLHEASQLQRDSHEFLDVCGVYQPQSTHNGGDVSLAEFIDSVQDVAAEAAASNCSSGG